MTAPETIQADQVRHDLVALAFHVDTARSLDDATEAYFLARRRFYGAADAVQTDDGVRHAWAQVIAAFGLACDRFATPVQPLVVLG